MKKKGIAAVGITAALICCMWFSSPMYRAGDAISVRVVMPEKKDIYDSVISRGSIEDGNAKAVRSEGAAKVSDVFVEIGQQVEKGQALMEIYPVKGSGIDIDAVYAMLPEVSSDDYAKIKLLLDEYDIDTDRYFASAAIFNETKEAIKLVSPISGVVTQLNANADSFLSGYGPAAVISDMSQLYVRVQIPEMYIGRIKVGQAAEITGDAFSKTYLGKVEKIYPTATQKSTLTGNAETVVDTLISISNADRYLKPGYSAGVKIFTSKKNKALTLPYSCVLQDEAEREYVFAIKDGVAYKKQVHTGLELENEVEITAGIDAGEYIADSPPSQLEDNGKVVCEESK